MLTVECRATRKLHAQNIPMTLIFGGISQPRLRFYIGKPLLLRQVAQRDIHMSQSEEEIHNMDSIMPHFQMDMYSFDLILRGCPFIKGSRLQVTGVLIN